MLWIRETVKFYFALPQLMEIIIFMGLFYILSPVKKNWDLHVFIKIRYNDFIIREFWNVETFSIDTRK